MEAGSKLGIGGLLPAGLRMSPGGWTFVRGLRGAGGADGWQGVGIAATLDRIELLPQIG
jgi:hypothetical protein